MNDFKFQLEHIFTFDSLLQSPEVIGPVAEGIRANFYALGGEITGPKLNGKCRAAGGDWITVRTDGVAILDVRITLETHDGAMIGVSYSGVGDIGPDGYQRFIEGKLPPKLTLQIVPRFQTAHPDYLWLNRLQCLGLEKLIWRHYMSVMIFMQ